MKSLKIAGLCLASMLVMSMALAGSAEAALLWLVCLESSGLTKYENSKCLKANGKPNSENGWQSLGVRTGQSITVKILAITIALQDTGAHSAVRCFSPGSRGLGLIGPNGEGEIKVAEYPKAKENCRGIEGCETNGVEIVEGINLPWKQELIEGPEGKHLGVIRAGNTEGKMPGYTIKCKVLGISVTDTCEEELEFPEKVELINERTTNPSGVEELLVRSRFEEVSHGKCTVGGANTSRVLGLTAILLPGGAVSINKF